MSLPAWRVTTLDGTPADRLALHRQLSLLAGAFSRPGRDLAPVDVAKVERAVLALHPDIRRAVRAHKRREHFERQLTVWQQERRALRQAGLARDLIDQQTHNLRPPYYAPDKRGRYTWARRELAAELRAAWTRSRRTDRLQTKIVATVRTSILEQIYPDFEPGRDVDRGVAAAVHRLTAKFLQVHFPFTVPGATAHRLRNRSSVPRVRSN